MCCYLVGLLDVYGFESFSVNSLEQLCINYANERLQQYFVQQYLKDVQAEYATEGISWQHVKMTSDNMSCIHLLSGNPGIFAVLDEASCLIVDIWSWGGLFQTILLLQGGVS